MAVPTPDLSQSRDCQAAARQGYIIHRLHAGHAYSTPWLLLHSSIIANSCSIIANSCSIIANSLQHNCQLLAASLPTPCSIIANSLQQQRR
ncbi:hypothetical protein ACOMHN_036313 [Nucella lapillus]